MLKIYGEGLVDTGDAARRLCVSRSTLYRLMSSGDLPWVQVGGRRKFRPSDLDAYMADQVRTGASAPPDMKRPPRSCNSMNAGAAPTERKIRTDAYSE